MNAVGAEEGDRVPNVEKRGADVEQTALALPRNARDNHRVAFLKPVDALGRAEPLQNVFLG